MISKMSFKRRLTEKVWNKKTGYYDKARQASESVLSHTGFKIVNAYLKQSKSILDVGCGEGTKLSRLGNTKTYKVGVDISSTAIETAKKQYRGITFKKADIENLPFTDHTFDAVYSAFVLEHTEKPQVVIEEMIRVTKEKGVVIIICPNFGSPNRHSPCFTGSKIVKLAYGFGKQLLRFNLTIDTWERVLPLSYGAKHISDWDTVIEPELLTLINFLKEKRLTIQYWSCLWEEEVTFANKIQNAFRFLSNKDIYPFIYWGPQILVIGKKHD